MVICLKSNKNDKPRYKINDIVTVFDAGETYSTHLAAAKDLGADYDPADYDIFQQKQSGTALPLIGRPYITECKYKFKPGATPTSGDRCKCLNVAEDFVLVERLTDKQQFIISHHGLRLFKASFWEEDLFEI
jgi:hypothetical protein